MHQVLAVARQRSRIAAHVHDTRGAVRGQGFDNFDRTRTRRIEEHLVISRVTKELLNTDLAEIDDAKLRVFQTILLRVSAGALDQVNVALTAYDLAGATRERQRKVAETAKEIQCAVARPGIEEGNHAGYQLAIYRRVYLNEIGRPKIQTHVERGQRVRQRPRGKGPKWPRGRRIPRL